MEAKEYIKLLEKKLSQNATDQELRELDLARNSRKDFDDLYNFLTNNDTIDFHKEEESKETELAYATLFTKMHANGQFHSHNNNDEELKHTKNKTKVLVLKFIVSFAAAILLIFLGYYSFLYLKNSKGINWENSNVVITKKGQKSFLKLPDGTKVWLNVDSRLTYLDNFNGSTRQVKLVGEAFFDVAKDKIHPFIIHTNYAKIKVLGTAFNVKSYAKDTSMETLLVRGKIEVELNDKKHKKVIMYPGDKIKILHNNSGNNSIGIKSDYGKVVVDKIKLNQKELDDTLWLNNTIVFDYESISAIADKIEKWYNVTVIIENKDLKNFNFTGKFENESLDFVLSTLSETKKLNYKIDKDTVRIY